MDFLNEFCAIPMELFAVDTFPQHSASRISGIQWRSRRPDLFGCGCWCVRSRLVEGLEEGTLGQNMGHRRKFDLPCDLHPTVRHSVKTRLGAAHWFPFYSGGGIGCLFAAPHLGRRGLNVLTTFRGTKRLLSEYAT